MRMRRLACVVVVLVVAACRGADKPISADPAPSCSCGSAAASQKEEAIKIDLPKAQAFAPGENGDAVETLVAIDIDAHGAVSVNGVPAPDDAAIVDLVRKGIGPNTRAAIRADASVTHGRVIHVLDLVRSAGVAKIAFGAAVPAPIPAPAAP